MPLRGRTVEDAGPYKGVSNLPDKLKSAKEQSVVGCSFCFYLTKAVRRVVCQCWPGSRRAAAGFSSHLWLPNS